jgi:hypothetical protein
VLDLVNASAEAAATSNATSNNGLRIRAGTTATVDDNSLGAAPNEANMSTALATRNAFNLIGNDEVTNPVAMGITTGTNNSFDPTTSSTTALTPRNGTEPHGTNQEAEVQKGAKRYYCVGVFFPSDTDRALPTVYASDGTNEFIPTAYDSTTGQWTDCFTSNPALAPTGCASLGTGAQALTAANGKGDNAAGLGQVQYYLVVTAAQKTGRTTN